MLSHYRPPLVVFTFLAYQEIAAEMHPLGMGRRWHCIGFICDEAVRRRAGRPRPRLAANYLEALHTWPVSKAKLADAQILWDGGYPKAQVVYTYACEGECSRRPRETPSVKEFSCLWASSLENLKRISGAAVCPKIGAGNRRLKDTRILHYSPDFGVGTGRAGVESPFTKWAYQAR